MNRRYFLQLAGAAWALLGVGQRLVAKPQSNTPLDLAHTWGGLRDDQACFEGIKNSYEVKFEAPERIFMVTARSRKSGYESLPIPLVANSDGYLNLSGILIGAWLTVRAQEIAQDTPILNGHPLDQFSIYAPLPGSEQTGPWYWLKSVSRRDAKAARYMIAVPEYSINDLAPAMPPTSRTLFIEMPTPLEDQTHWLLKSYEGTTSAIIKCP